MPGAMTSAAVRRALALIVACAGFALPARAEQSPAPADPTRTALERLRVSIQRTTLPNGLRVVLQPESSVPTVAVAMTYDAGSKDEQPGQSGFAHLLEHLMFQGSKHVAPSQHFRLVAARGGIALGKSSGERTLYFQTLPANELALGLWLEADRLRWLSVTPQSFENQRKVVLEKYRAKVDNAAYFPSLLRVNELAFQGNFAYAHAGIGTRADLEAARYEWVLAFHRQYYAPNNAVLSIAGDFDPDQAMQLVHRYFGGAVSGPRPKFDPPALPPQTAERRESARDPHAKTPGLYSGWVIPASRTPAHYALELAALILADGESSRLHQRLIRATGSARSVGSWTGGSRGPDLFVVELLLRGGADPKAAARELDAEIRRLGQTGPTGAELERAQARLRTRFLFGLESNAQRATKLGEFELFWGDARLLTRELDAYRSVNARDIQRAVAEHLVPARLSAVEVMPAAAAAVKKP
jgi:predicted Zn-dependent peptidase